ncbi:transmembrane protein 231 isoform X2 [Bombyx mori]|uniref:Transmembrane protein 231 n=1 Tax=Bombyx mori TaxID=7091 RepID=A0A8R2QR18_BOMMO|nr:transmembrane protein 231 isoform X2 [Bombyx mori]
MLLIFNILRILVHRKHWLWVKYHSFYEQPTVHFTYEYVLIAETEDPSKPILCTEIGLFGNDNEESSESCAEMQVQENDFTGDGKKDELYIKFHLNIPPDRTVSSILLILSLDFQLKTICPLQMQSLALITKEFVIPPSELIFHGDLNFYQTTHLPCEWFNQDTKYNRSLFEIEKWESYMSIDHYLSDYFHREVTTEVRTINSRTYNGQTDSMTVQVHLRIPEMQIRYTPSILEEFKWAWPQYLSFVVIFHWFFNKVKEFIFTNRLLMSWKVQSWKTFE